MKKFLNKIIIFFIPIIGFVALPLCVLFFSGESLHSIDKYIINNDKYLIGYAYDETGYQYLKYKTLLLNEKYDILALGSSRVLQFRDKMFEKKFYNVGPNVSKIKEFKLFLQSIPESKYPDYLIIGLDQWMFNESWDDLSDNYSYEKWFKYRQYPNLKTLIDVYRDLFNGKITMGRILTKQNQTIGINALMNSRGFRNDGSMNYGNQIEQLINNDSTVDDYMFSDTYNRIDNGGARFEYSSVANPEAVKILDDFLEFCRLNEIQVIGFLPPLANGVFEKMQSSNNYSYIDNLEQDIGSVFKKYNFEFYNFNSAAHVNSSDNEMIDGFHGGEAVYLKILIQMLDAKSILNEVSSIDILKSQLKNAKNSYRVYAD